MDDIRTPKPDPIIINHEPMVTPQISPTPTSDPLALSNTEKIKAFIRKNKKLVAASLVLLLALCVIVTIIILTGSQSTKTQVTPTPIVSAPIINIVSKPTLTPAPTPASVTSTTLQFSEDNVLNVNQQPVDTLSGTIIVDSDVTLSKPTNYKLIFKKGSSSFTITNFYEEFDHKLIDASFIGTTKTLGNTYRVSQVNPSTGQTEYYYVQPNKIKLTGTCNPASYPSPIAAPCGQTNYQDYYFQCTGDLNFDFCDKIMSDLNFTIITN